MLDLDVVLDHLDDAARLSVFESFRRKLEACPNELDLDALAACSRLLPRSGHEKQNAEIVRLVLNALPSEQNTPERVYQLAVTCMSDPRIGNQICQDIFTYLSGLRLTFVERVEEEAFEEELSKAFSYMSFLKCSYWRSLDQNHYITLDLIQVLVDFLGHERLDGPAHDTLSSLLALLRKLGPESGRHDSSSHPKLSPLVVGQQLWTRLKDLPSSYFSAVTGKVYRTWFQWVSYAAANGLELDGIYETLYWSRIRTGLLLGFSEQRKYCLGILRQSLLLARQDIDTPLMVLETKKRHDYEQQYAKYCSLFETIVLDRYANQIQACLPDLTNLLAGSYIRAGWTTALLSAVLDPKIQDGPRKIVGTWYIDFVIQEKAAVDQHAHFLIEGFLPWATQGSLFTTTLVTTRSYTACGHGQALADVVCRFIQTMPTATDRRELFNDIIRFILDKGGRIFHYAIIYLLQGLEEGFSQQQAFGSDPCLGTAELGLLAQVARLPGLPEIATELCATYCALLSRSCMGKEGAENVPGYQELSLRLVSSQRIETQPAEPTDNRPLTELETSGDASLQSFLVDLDESQHRNILGNNFTPACLKIMRILDTGAIGSSQCATLHRVLEAFWEEADRQEFRRSVADKIPPLLFHSTCIDLCLLQHSDASTQTVGESLTTLLTKAMDQLGQLSAGRTYLLSTFTDSLRQASLRDPRILSILPFENFLSHFIEQPPLPRRDFLFEVAAAEALQQHSPRQTYGYFYGKREWHAYACVIDLLNRFPQSSISVAQRVLKRILGPWRSQVRPVPIITKWKETFQLQAMLVLADSCVFEEDAAWYLDSFLEALHVERWPRYRYLLEWIISRIYYRFPSLADRILPDLENLDDTFPAQIASLMKLAVLAAPFLNSEPFTLRLASLLVPFSANPKIQIRHEAHWCFPHVFGVAEERGWKTIVENPAFSALNSYLRSLAKFSAPAATSRTLMLDAIQDFNLVKIFQGDYLTIDSPEPEFVASDDFEDLWKQDRELKLEVPPARVPLGAPKSTSPAAIPVPTESQITNTQTTQDQTTAPLQTKSGFDLASLLPTPGPPSASQIRPTSVILIASLIDNPTNLGGLSRISESFGLESLYINDLKHLAHKDFQATSVTSHKHLPIHELKIPSIPSFINDCKTRGYEVVGVEQTDRSGMLGDANSSGKAKGDGTLPKKCVLVLGSEKGGITAEVLATVDRCVEIKTVGVTRSLNVQTAGGIAVFEWWREWGGR